MKAVCVFVVALGVAIVVSYTILLGLGPLVAQTPAPVPTVAAPKDELVDAWLDTAKLAAQLANSHCQQLESVKQLRRVQADATKKVEARLPGYTVNWTTFSIVPKNK